MLVFVDDSGDPGFKIGKGSSPVFVISCVIFDDDLEAEKTADEILLLIGAHDNAAANVSENIHRKERAAYLWFLW